MLLKPDVTRFLNLPTSEASLFRKSSSSDAALGLAKLVTVTLANVFGHTIIVLLKSGLESE
jgi:hypothetical protein